MDQITLTAQPRSALGKKVGALRRSGITPIHVYGSNLAPQVLQADTQTLIHTLGQVGYTTPLTVQVSGEEHFVIVQEVQRHPVTDQLLHVDLITLSRTERRQAAVPLHFEGESLAAREEGAQVFEDLHTLEVEALPTDVPSVLTVDLSLLTEPDSVIHAADLELPANVTLVTDPQASVARIVHRRAAAEEVEEAPEAEAEGEAPEAQEEQPVADDGEGEGDGD